MHISNLRGSDQIQGTYLVFVMWWSIERTMVSEVHEILVVSKYLDVIPDDLLGLPPEYKLKFTIKLVFGILCISKAPYRMAPTKLIKLKKHLQELLDMGFIN